MGRVLSEPPPEVKPIARPGWVSQERRYSLITPLVGGGVTPTYRDETTPIRGSEIRGQLRFWWRACRGASDRATDAERLDDMRTREAAIWGMAALDDGAVPSQVQIRLVVEDGGTRKAWDDPSLAGVKYALFPLEPHPRDDGFTPSGAVWEGVRFRLWLTYPESVRAEVEAALWAWETFGGLGARTRRGCGAVQCTAVDQSSIATPPTRADLEQAIADGLQRHVRTGEWPKATPRLLRPSQAIYKVTNAKGSATAAWSHLVRQLRNYRQQRRGAFGRSLWPEPDTIRQRVLARYGGVLPATRSRLTTVERFPRAQFGLPIVFHFYKEPVAGDYSVTLQGRDQGFARMASPLILRPLALAGKDACGLALLLSGRKAPPNGIALSETPTTPERMGWTTPELAQVQADTALPGPPPARLDAGEDPVAYFVGRLKP